MEKREIKFRVWDSKYKDMTSFESMQSKARLAIDSELDSSQFILLPKHENIVLMQYTGLKDKNGVEIYEGDIIQVKNCIQQDDNNFYLSKDVVTFRSGGFCATSRLNEWYTKNNNCLWEYLFVVKNVSRESYHKQFDAEIIGNIYENPDLINS